MPLLGLQALQGLAEMIVTALTLLLQTLLYLIQNPDEIHYLSNVSDSQTGITLEERIVSSKPGYALIKSFWNKEGSIGQDLPERQWHQGATT